MCKKWRKARRVASLYLWWTIWKERNKRALNDVKQSNQVIKYVFMYTFVDWPRVYIKDHTLSMLDLVDWLSS